MKKMRYSEGDLLVTISDRGKELSKFLVTYPVCKNKRNQHKNTSYSQTLSSLITCCFGLFVFCSLQAFMLTTEI